MTPDDCDRAGNAIAPSRFLHGTGLNIHAAFRRLVVACTAMKTQRHTDSAGRDEFRAADPLVAGRRYFIVSVLPLVAALTGVAPSLSGWLVGAAIAGLGAFRSISAWRERTLLRRLADEQLRFGRLPTATPVLSWRAGELVSAGNRRIIARSLRAIVTECETGPVRLTILNRRGVRQHLDLIRPLAERVGKLEQPVSARGMALIEHLLCDGFGPLYAHGKVDGLDEALARCSNALEPLSEREPAARRFPLSRTTRLIEAPTKARTVHHRGRR